MLHQLSFLSPVVSSKAAWILRTHPACFHVWEQQREYAEDGLEISSGLRPDTLQLHLGGTCKVYTQTLCLTVIYRQLVDEPSVQTGGQQKIRSWIRECIRG